MLLHSPSPERTLGQDQTPLCPDPPSLGVPGVGITATEPLSARSCLAATPTHNHRRACLKMKVFVCCASSKYPRAHPGGCGRAGAARLAGGSPIPPGGEGELRCRASRKHDPRPLSPSTASHSGEKLAPTLPQFTLRPEVKIEDLGESGTAPGPAAPHPRPPPPPLGQPQQRGGGGWGRPAALLTLSLLPTENFNPEMPKLEKSISGTSPKREHLPLAVAAALFLMTLLAS